MEVSYINTDLDIESAGALSRIIEEFGEEVFVLHHGAAKGYNRASFEISGPGECADDTIGRFCHLVEQLSEDARQLWDACVSRTFDIGYDSGDSANRHQSALRPQTIRRAADIGAGITITIYPTRWGSN